MRCSFSSSVALERMPDEIEDAPDGMEESMCTC